MSIPSYTGLDTALRGLSAAQAAIDTTANNIANANNAGYSRQTAVLTESTPLTLPAANGAGTALQLGTGVDVTAISRIRDQFLDIQYRAQNTNTSQLSTSSAFLQQVQTALAEPSAQGLSSQLTAFWNSWSDLAQAPSSAAAKQAVVDAANALADTFNGLESQLQGIQSQASQQLGWLTGPSGQVQADANQIATLNGQISQAQAAGVNPNQLLDQRDQLLDDLSTYGTVSVTDPGNGLLVVNFGGDTTTPLINGKTANSAASLNLGGASGGTLGALATVAAPNGPISGYLNTLANFAGTLTTAVNSIHTTAPVFSVATTTTALGASATTLSVAATPGTIQATATTNAGASEVALGIAGLAGGAVDQGYAAFVTHAGADVQSAQRSLASAQTLSTAINQQRQSTSGVSLDEEMANLVRYQQAYQASARAMTTIDSALDTLINHTGTVGL